MYVIYYVSKEFCINQVGSVLELGLTWLGQFLDFSSHSFAKMLTLKSRSNELCDSVALWIHMYMITTIGCTW